MPVTGSVVEKIVIYVRILYLVTMIASSAAGNEQIL